MVTLDEREERRRERDHRRYRIEERGRDRERDRDRNRNEDLDWEGKPIVRGQLEAPTDRRNGNIADIPSHADKTSESRLIEDPDRPGTYLNYRRNPPPREQK